MIHWELCEWLKFGHADKLCMQKSELVWENETYKNIRDFVIKTYHLIPVRKSNLVFISYTFIDASGWVISDVSFGFMGGGRVLLHQTPSPKWPSWHWSYSNSHPGSKPAHPHKEKKMTTEMALYINPDWFNKTKRTCHLIEFAVVADHVLKIKENEKVNKYLDLARELKKLWDVKMTDY